ncbi:hypothetical protein PM082_003580 [Marasmius tenuissimus]|nr:hypothetical protein PM082_003580 [Marasmius tenuissimus]
MSIPRRTNLRQLITQHANVPLSFKLQIRCFSPQDSKLQYDCRCTPKKSERSRFGDDSSSPDIPISRDLWIRSRPWSWQEAKRDSFRDFGWIWSRRNTLVVDLVLEQEEHFPSPSVDALKGSRAEYYNYDLTSVLNDQR